MDRTILYPGAIPLETDLMSSETAAMIQTGFLAQMALGVGSIVDGLACTPTVPASMTVNIGPGAYLTQQQVDATALSSLPPNGAAVMKLGINTGSIPFTLTAPATSGQSINYLIEATFSETDTGATVLPYYNAANPGIPYSGPANAGTAQNTQRVQRVALQVKPGAPANAGTQITPANDSNYVALYVITVNYGQTTITASSISVSPGASFLNATQGYGLKPGRLLAVQRFTASGTYTPSIGTTMFIAQGIGGGGGGGGAQATSASQSAAGGGGGTGAFGVARGSIAFTTLPVVIGAAGIGQSNASGTNGGATSLGSLLVCPGGIAGTVGSAQPGAAVVLPGIGGATPSGANLIEACDGENGDNGIVIIGGVSFSGRGGSGRMGSGGGNTVNGNGGPGRGLGAGGGGGGCSPSNGPFAGGYGAGGGLIIYEFS